MAGSMWWCLLITVLGFVEVIAGACSTSTGVCSSSVSFSQSYQESYSSSYSQRYYSSCGIFGWDRCTRHRTATRTSYRQKYRTRYRAGTRCCTGWTASGSRCSPVCSSSCLNGGTCCGPNTCSCVSGYTGTRCQTAICSPSCSNSGTCIRPNTCSCSSGFTGNRCQTPICSPICSNGGTCVRPNTCSCPSGYTGNRCQTPICSPSCSNGGTCTRPNTCSCSSRYTGNRCQTPICSPSCSNGGACTRPNTCTCPSGYTGNRCQTPICSPLCSNGGSCTRPNTCSCPSEYTGNRCQTPICTPSCSNSGTCTRPNTCSCSSGYIGYQCQTPTCDPSCLHGGICVSPNLCSCQPGFTGSQCQIASNTCPNDIMVSNDPGEDGAVVDWREILMNYTSITSTHKPRDFFPVGATTVTYSFMNITVNSMCSFLVYVEDIEPPKIDCPANSTYIVTGGISIPVSWSQPRVVDNSDGEIRKTYSNYHIGSYFTIGATIVTYRAVDSSGNIALCYFQVNIKAQCPPVQEDTSVGILSWQQIDVGITVESEQRCPVDSERRNYGIATRTCSLDNDIGPVWSEPQIRDCGRQEDIDEGDVAQIPITQENVVEVSEALANITSQVDSLSRELDIGSVGQAVTNIANAGSSSLEVTEAVVKVVDNVLSISNGSIYENSTSSNYSTSRIVKALERQIATTLENEGNFQSVQPNIAVEAVRFNHTEVSSGLGFATIINNTDDVFTTSNIMRFTTDNRPATEDVSSSIELPPDVFSNMENKSDITVTFVVYRDDTLFRSPRLSRPSSTISGIIISAVVRGAIGRFKRPVVYRILPSKVKVNQLNHASTCVYWDFNLNGGNGDWSEDGCEMVNADDGRVTCQCNHLTNFAVLLDISGQTGTPSDKFNFALDVISKIGCAVSIAALCITLFIFLIARRLRLTLSRKLLINFCTSMLALYLVFLVGIDAAKTGNEIGCQIVGALLHYFLLTTVFWMGIEARQMYIMLVNVFDGGPGSHFLLKASCFAWGLPTICVAVSLVLQRDDYNINEYCFLSPGNVFYYGLILPVAIVLLHNMVTFVLVMRRLCKARLGGSVTDKTKLQQISQRMQNAFAISVLMGLCWVFGFLAIDEARSTFQFLFCICNSLQGFMVFILFCVRQDDVRKTIRTSFNTGSTTSKGSTLSTKKKNSSTELNLSQHNSGYVVTPATTEKFNDEYDDICDTSLRLDSDNNPDAAMQDKDVQEYSSVNGDVNEDLYDEVPEMKIQNQDENIYGDVNEDLYDDVPEMKIENQDENIYEDCEI